MSRLYFEFEFAINIKFINVYVLEVVAITGMMLFGKNFTFIMQETIFTRSFTNHIVMQCSVRSVTTVLKPSTLLTNRVSNGSLKAHRRPGNATYSSSAQTLW